MQINDVVKVGQLIKDNVGKVIIGKQEVCDIILTSVISGGHVLLEDVPGTGKTMIAKSFALSIGGEFKRIQFTPDLLPTDLTGISYYNQKQGEFTYRKGPIFTNILLADEINRATPRTQSSLLECMEEKQVTFDGVTYQLDRPFLVIATQNPVETQGTFPLPEAQLDRFFVKLNMGYPSVKEGKEIFKRFMSSNPIEDLKSVVTKGDIVEAGKACLGVSVSDDIQEYMLNIADRTLNNDNILLGVSPRGSLALLKGCQVYAALKGREYVTPEDVKKLVPYVFGHRVIIKDTLKYKGVTSTKVLEDILAEVEVPTEKWSRN